MNREDIIRMAREAGVELTINEHGNQQFRCFVRELQRFAALVASAAQAKEREACANICETLELPEWPDKVRQPLAQAIRARGQA